MQEDYYGQTDVPWRLEQRILVRKVTKCQAMLALTDLILIYYSCRKLPIHITLGYLSKTQNQTTI